MKALILNGMHAGDEVTALVQDTLVDVLQSKGWEVQPFMLHEMRIRPCAGCFGCWMRTPGQCASHDSDDIARAMVQSDLMVFLTPVTFGGYSSELKKAVDHTLFIELPFFRAVGGRTGHWPRYPHYPSLLVLGVMPEPDESSQRIFTSLARQNAFHSFPRAWAAGFITSEQAQGDLHRQLQSLLSRVEVH